VLSFYDKLYYTVLVACRFFFVACMPTYLIRGDAMVVACYII